MSFDEVLVAAIELSDNDRARLVAALVETLPSDEASQFDKDLWSEVERRSREVDEGTATLIPWDEVRSKIRERLRRNG